MKRISLLMTILAVAGADAVAARQSPYETTRVGDGVYRFRYQAHVALFVETDDGVVAFDPISTAAAAVYAREIKRVTDQSLAAIVYSHHHADHTTGARVLMDAFGTDVPIIAQENARAPLVEAGNPDQPAPGVTFNRQLTLHFGGRPIELHHFGANHSDNSLVAVLPEDRIAFAVDFVAHDRMAYRDLPGMDFAGLLHSLAALRELPFDTIVFGHGDVGTRASVDRQLQYYYALRTAVQDAIAAGQTADQAAARIRFDDYAHWESYEQWFEMNVRGMYRILTEGNDN